MFNVNLFLVKVWLRLWGQVSRIGWVDYWLKNQGDPNEDDCWVKGCWIKDGWLKDGVDQGVDKGVLSNP